MGYRAVRTERYKYIQYLELQGMDELYDLQEDPHESKNLLYDPKFKAIATDMEKKLYATMADLGGMEIPLNPPIGRSSNKRLAPRDGQRSADFPEPLIVDQPINVNAN